MTERRNAVWRTFWSSSFSQDDIRIAHKVLVWLGLNNRLQWVRDRKITQTGSILQQQVKHFTNSIPESDAIQHKCHIHFHEQKLGRQQQEMWKKWSKISVDGRETLEVNHSLSTSKTKQIQMTKVLPYINLYSCSDSSIKLGLKCLPFVPTLRS